MQIGQQGVDFSGSYVGEYYGQEVSDMRRPGFSDEGKIAKEGMSCGPDLAGAGSGRSGKQAFFSLGHAVP